MKIKYLAHASFLFETKDGIKIITDPYEPNSFGGNLKYKPITEKADIVLVSHGHSDHNYPKGIPGNPIVLNKPGDFEFKGITLKGIFSYHDKTSGSQRGENTIFKFFADGINFCHLGDLGQLITPEQKNELGKIDVLLTPVGGIYTITPDDANKVANDITPKVIIPMHYKTPGLDAPLSSVDDFIKLRSSTLKNFETSTEIKLPSQEEIWVFKPELL